MSYNAHTCTCKSFNLGNDQLFPLSPSLSVAYEMLSVEKLMIVAMKLSLRRTPRIAFQSVAGSPMRRQMDSIAILIIFGGFARARISTRCCLLIDFTAEGDRVHEVALRETLTFPPRITTAL